MSLQIEPLAGERSERVARRRRGVERDNEAQVFGRSRVGFNIENARTAHRVIAWALQLALLYSYGQRQAERVVVRENRVRSPRLPASFDGLRVLHLSDLHADMSGAALTRATALIEDLSYDLCVVTGDYRGDTAGPFDAALVGMEPLAARIQAPTLAVLGNHDSIDMVPGLEAMGFRCLLNEAVRLARGDEAVYLAGVDDAHFYRTDSLDRALDDVPVDAFTVLLSHTPELWRQAAHSGVDLMLSGHTHGGQICLPGGVPIFLSAKLPRRLGRGAWRHHDLAGYTSVGCGTCVVPVRLNCPPEITLHRLERVSQ